MSHREPKPDLINSLIGWLARESTLSVEQLKRMEDDLRDLHGAKWQYISGRTFFALSERNTMIQSAWISGVPGPIIARRFRITSRRVRQICAGIPAGKAHAGSVVEPAPRAKVSAQARGD